ncbi:MAG: hypothetical protein ACRYF5_16685 [Janthinobacterium lividum]
MNELNLLLDIRARLIRIEEKIDAKSAPCNSVSEMFLKKAIPDEVGYELRTHDMALQEAIKSVRTKQV